MKIKQIIFFLLCLVFLYMDGMSSMRKDSVLIGRLSQIHLHFDKSSYLPGDTVWFKGYVMEGGQPDVMSGSLYVDWADESEKVLRHDVHILARGLTRGHFEIPRAYEGDGLYLLAYTHEIKNIDSAFRYLKYLPVLQTNEKSLVTVGTTAVEAVEEALEFKLNLFPEGGQMVRGLKSRLAFKATGQYGRPASVSGKIVDNQGEEVLRFSTEHDGMGEMVLFAPLRDNYEVVWTDSDGKEHRQPLPKLKDQGMVLRLNSTVNSIQFIITSNGETEQSLKLKGTMYGKIVFEKDLEPIAGSALQGEVQLDGVPSGIVCFTLLGADGIPLAERVVFVNSGLAGVIANVKSTAVSLEPKSLNIFNISLPDQRMSSSLSVSITDAVVGVDSSSGIVDALLLSSELRGKINNPAQYFSDTSARTIRNLDLVMLTHGWRRYNIQNNVELSKEIEPGIVEPNLIDSNRISGFYLNFSGKVIMKKNKDNQLPGLLTYRSLKDTVWRYEKVLPDSNGYFSLPQIIFFDSLEVVYRTIDKKRRFDGFEIAYMPERLVAPQILNVQKWRPNIKGTPDLADLKTSLAIRKESIPVGIGGTLLREVEIKAKAPTQIELLDKRFSSPMFSAQDAISFDVMNDERAMAAFNIFQYLQSAVPGLKITFPTGIKASKNPFLSPTIRWRGEMPAFYLDETPIDIDGLRLLSMDQIGYVKAFRPPFMGSQGGAIVIYSRRGDQVDRSSAAVIDRQTIAGYTVLKEFYHPDYSNEQSKEKSGFDARETLYWNPMLSIDKENPIAEIIFYNNSRTKDYWITIEGMAEDGQLIHYRKLIN